MEFNSKAIGEARLHDKSKEWSVAQKRALGKCRQTGRENLYSPSQGLGAK
jgi:hypothetical protein